MKKFSTALLRDSFRETSEDRVEVRQLGDRVLIALADGAGGQSGGASAAEFAVRSMLEYKGAQDAAGWVMCLAEIDRRLSEGAGGGETTAVAALISPESIVGASVGDSGAWYVQDGGYQDLTQRQQRKPLLGSGVSVPVMFRHGTGEGVLLVATDGLLKYASAEMICEVARRSDLEQSTISLVDLVRLKSGALQDDVAIALCRR
jgi:serine/threonine protein phosphatase PrpC